MGAERIRLLQEAAEKSKEKSGLDRLDVFLEYGERLAAGAPLSDTEKKALLTVVTESIPEGEKRQLEQMMHLFGAI